MSVLKSIGEGLNFSISVKKFAPYLILHLVTFYVLMGFFGEMVRLIINPTGLGPFLVSLLIYIPSFIILGLIKLWISGAIIDQAKYYRKKRRLIKSFKHSTSRFLTMLCALIIFAVIAAIVSLPRYIGSVLSILLGLIFFYLYPAIIIDNKSCIDSFKWSWKIFKKYPLETFATWLLIIIIGFIITIIFALPMISYLLGNLVNIFQTMDPTGINETMSETIFREEIIPTIANSVRSVYFLPYLFVLCFGLAIQEVFSAGAQARLYINLKRRRF